MNSAYDLLRITHPSAGDAHREPSGAEQIVVAVQIAVPLVGALGMLTPVVLHDDLVRRIDEVTAADEATTFGDVDVAFRLG